MFLYADSMMLQGDKICVVGWAGSANEENSVEYSVLKNGQKVDFSVTLACRPDVGYSLYKDPTHKDLGYFIQIPNAKSGTYKLVAYEVENGVRMAQKSIIISKPRIQFKKRMIKVKGWYLNARKEIVSLLNKVLRRNDTKYAGWFQTMRTTPTELDEQRKNKLDYEPLISILVPVFRTPKAYLRDLLRSVVHQTYKNWELCIVNADPSCEEVKKELAIWQENDPRIRIQDLEENRGIADNTNDALKMAKGEFVAMLDHDDLLEYDTLYRYVQRINEKPETDLLYCDEDKVNEASDYFFYPNFKPDYNPDMLYNNNYMCHLLMVRKKLADEVGGWNREFNGAQDYDFIMHCVEKARNIEHIEKVLYHWRSYKSSTSQSTGNKQYAVDAGARAINAYYQRNGINAVAEPTEVGGWYKSEYKLTSEPLVSVLIPSKDHTDDLDVCIRSLFEKCTYKNIEVIIIENNSTEEETFKYYEEVQKRYDKVKVIYYKGGFNFSRINNFGFSYSKGEYILLLNNDVEVITPNLFESMLGYMTRPEVGMVGVKLLYNDNTIQHAGVLVGAGGLADHSFKGFQDRQTGYMCRAITAQDVSAVTAACMLVRRSAYEEAGGLDEKLEVAFNDVDFCLQIRKLGYLIVYDPYAKLYHYESKSRGAENTPEKFVRFGNESVRLNSKWGILTSFQDPYYNPNMSYLNYYMPTYNQIPDRTKEIADKYAVSAMKDNALLDYYKEHLGFWRHLKFYLKDKKSQYFGNY